MEIIHHDKPVLKKNKMNCDQPLDRKLDQNPITALMNKSHFASFIGGPGSGKSTLWLGMLTTRSMFHGVFDSIYLFMPKNSLNSIIGSDLEDLPENHVFDEVTLNDLDHIFEKAKAETNEATKKKKHVKNTLIIFDDVQDAFKIPILEKQLKKMLCNRRHAHLSVWISVQNFNSIGKQTRKHLTDMFIFSCSKSEMDLIFTEKIQQSKDKFEFLFDEVLFQEPHQFFYNNCDSRRIFNDWEEEIVFPNKRKRDTIER